MKEILLWWEVELTFSASCNYHVHVCIYVCVKGEGGGAVELNQNSYEMSIHT